MKSKKVIIVFIILFISILIGFYFISASNKPITKTGLYFDTVINVTVYKENQHPLLDECMNLADYYDHLLSTTIEGSDIYKINHSNSKPVTVSNDTLELLQIAINYAQQSDGIVDPTIGSLSALWNFGSSSQEIVPTDTAIKDSLSHVNYEKIIIKNNTVTLVDSDASIDLGFIAKGFIADKLKKYLLENKVENAIIELGGNVLTIGNKPNGKPYKVGVQKPFAPTGTPLLTLELSDCSTVSSGIYERYFEKNGNLYHHILSTNTGYPIDNNLASVTIISPKSVDGDALSTLCFALGVEKGTELIKSKKEISAIFLLKDGTIHTVNR